MAEKAHVVVWKSVVVEEWLVEGATNATEAKRLFHEGKARLSSRSEADDGCVRAVRRATHSDIDSADLNEFAAILVGEDFI